MERFIGIASVAIATFPISLVAAWALWGWHRESQDRRDIQQRFDSLRDNFDSQKRSALQFSRQANQFFDLADDLRGIEREDD